MESSTSARYWISTRDERAWLKPNKGSGDSMGKILRYSLVAAASASLLAAGPVILFHPHPKRLMVGYLLGGLLVSLTTGFVIVFAVHHSAATRTAQNSISPAMDIALGLILLVVAYVLGSKRAARRRERKKKEKEGIEKG